MKDFGKILKEAEQFRELLAELPVLIQLSNKKKYEIYKKAGISETHYHRLMEHPEKFKAKHFISLLRSIIEIDNYERIKNK